MAPRQSARPVKADSLRRLLSGKVPGRSSIAVRILILNDRLYPDFIGGVERRNFDLAIALSRRGHEITMAGFGRGPASPEPGITILSLGDLGRLYSAEGKRSTIQAFRFAWYVFRLDLSRFDVIEASNIPYVHIPPLAVRCAAARKPLLVTWYEFWGVYWKKYVGRLSPLYRAGEWLTSQLGAGVTAISALTARRLEKSRRRGDSVHIVPCGIYLSELQESTRDVSHDRRTVIYAGRLIAEKQVGLLIRAMARLRDRGFDARLVIYGEGPELGALRALARCLALDDRVEFRNHVDDGREVWRAMKSAAVAVQPSSREGFGIFPLEAMALGLPVVYCSSPDNAVAELVRHESEGLCVEPDARAIAEAIERLLRDDAERAAFGASGALRARAFDWREIGDAMESLIRSLAVPRAAGARSMDASAG